MAGRPIFWCWHIYMSTISGNICQCILCIHRQLSIVLNCVVELNCAGGMLTPALPPCIKSFICEMEPPAHRHCVCVSVSALVSMAPPPLINLNITCSCDQSCKFRGEFRNHLNDSYVCFTRVTSSEREKAKCCITKEGGNYNEKCHGLVWPTLHFKYSVTHHVQRELLYLVRPALGDHSQLLLVSPLAYIPHMGCDLRESN